MIAKIYRRLLVKASIQLLEDAKARINQDDEEYVCVALNASLKTLSRPFRILRNYLLSKAYRMLRYWIRKQLSGHGTMYGFAATSGRKHLSDAEMCRIRSRWIDLMIDELRRDGFSVCSDVPVIGAIR